MKKIHQLYKPIYSDGIRNSRRFAKNRALYE